MERRKLFAYIALILAEIFWGISFVWTKELLNNGFNVIFIVTTRLIISFTLLYAFFKIIGRIEKIEKSDYSMFCLLAFFEPFLYFIGENYGLKHVDASFAAICIAVIPIIVPFGMYVFYREKINLSIVVGVIISVVGIMIMSMNNGFSLSFNVSVKGVLLLSLAVVSAVAYNIILFRLFKYSAVTIVTFQNFISAIYYLPLFLFVDKQELLQMNWNTNTVFALVLLSVFCSSIAFIGYSYSSKIISISRANVFTNAIPVFTIIFAVMIGQETITVTKITGMAIVILGVLVSQLIKSKK